VIILKRLICRLSGARGGVGPEGCACGVSQGGIAKQNELTATAGAATTEPMALATGDAPNEFPSSKRSTGDLKPNELLSGGISAVQKLMLLPVASAIGSGARREPRTVAFQAEPGTRGLRMRRLRKRSGSRIALCAGSRKMPLRGGWLVE